MKDFITTIASLILLMIFLLQFVTNQSIYTKMAAAEYAIKEFCIEAEEEREISVAEMRNLKERVAKLLDCTADEVRVTVSREAESTAQEGDADADKNGAQTISYEVSMPIRGLIGAADFLGISEEENQTVYSSKGIIRIAAEEDDEEGEEGEDTDSGIGGSEGDDSTTDYEDESKMESEKTGDTENEESAYNTGFDDIIQYAAAVSDGI